MPLVKLISINDLQVGCSRQKIRRIFLILRHRHLRPPEHPKRSCLQRLRCVAEDLSTLCHRWQDSWWGFHEVAEQPPSTGTVESRSPCMKTGSIFDFYGTGQSTNGVHSKQVGFGFLTRWIVLRGSRCYKCCSRGWGFFDNTVLGLVMGDGVQFQVNRSLVETSISDSNGIHLPFTIRVKIWLDHTSSFFCC